MRFEIYGEGVAKDGRSGTAISNLTVVPIKIGKTHHLIVQSARSYVVFVVVRFMLFKAQHVAWSL